ncbi:alpha/beta hydrolase [Ferrimonas gelatinilytica]|uniref:Alpha/beta hydrolase n=1 Tax=Ferrimonas gelatinilytica TaxID=1255257 RepID=A0ABP9S513_9GAMM
MSQLQLLAGAEAAAQIRQHGLVPELFDRVIAASGGPKWLPLAQLDRHLLYRFFPGQQSLSLLGTSSGAWRCAMMCHPDGDQAHQRLERGYIHQRYETRPTPAEVDEQCHGLLADAVDGDGPALLANPHRRLNMILCRGRHLSGSDSRALQVLGLGGTALGNLVSRKALPLFWQRWLLSVDAETPFAPMRDLPTKRARLNQANLMPALLATGSIPLVLSGVTSPPGLPAGRYFDGGITDYHLDLPSLRTGGLTLYPHFYSQATPGWFDKKLAWRRADRNFSRVVMLAPSDQFVAHLPGAKLPDRTDFSRYDSETRIRLWEAAVAQGAALVSAFEQLRTDPLRYLRSI